MTTLRDGGVYQLPNGEQVVAIKNDGWKILNREEYYACKTKPMYTVRGQNLCDGFVPSGLRIRDLVHLGG